MQKLRQATKRASHTAKRKKILEWFRKLFSIMLCTVKGRDKQGYSLEGEDVVPEN